MKDFEYNKNLKIIANEEVVNKYIKEKYDIKKVICFFDNENFLITEYIPINNGIHLIIELNNGVELHFDNCNCGYIGNGTRNTERIFNLFKVPKNIIDMVFYKDTVNFYKEDGEYKLYKFDFSQIYCSKIRLDYNNLENNSIITGNNISVDYERQKVKLYNPQRNFLIGFLRLINILKIDNIEYYLGKNSPLENNYTISYYEKNNKDIDVKGTYDINLVLYSKNYTITCLIDKKDIVNFIDLVYYNLTGNYVFSIEERKILLSNKKSFLDFLKFSNKEKLKELKDEVHTQGVKYE